MKVTVLVFAVELQKVYPEIHPIASSRFLLSITERVMTTLSNRMKFRLQKVRIPCIPCDF